MKDLDSAGIKDFINAKREGDYLLVDVRQPEEYEAGHIPGASLIPLPELEPRLFDLPQDKDLLFYCRSGARSRNAAMLAEEAEVTEKSVYNLSGGIMAWQGKTLTDFPRVQLFGDYEDEGGLLLRAMDLEKGAWRFYSRVAAAHEDLPVASTMKALTKAEVGHGRLIYGFIEKSGSNDEPFEELWEGLSGNILEGGRDLNEAIDALEGVRENLCMALIELSLEIEYSAFDLYRNMAERFKESEAGESFLSIAQAEKGHMRLLTEAIPSCEQGSP